VAASETTLTELFGVGPIIACYLIGFTGDIARFAGRDAYAAYNGTAPVERSSGGRVVHRVSQRGNRRLNHALHLAAICQIRQPRSEGRVYFERKVAEGKPRKSRSTPSSDTSATPSTACSSSTPPGPGRRTVRWPSRL
jgi:transposase